MWANVLLLHWAKTLTRASHHTIGFRYRQSISGFVAKQPFRDWLPDCLGGLVAMRFDLSGCGAGLDETAKELFSLGPLAESAWLRRAVDQRGAFRARKPNLSVANPACNCASDADTHDPYRLLSSGLAAFRTDTAGRRDRNSRRAFRGPRRSGGFPRQYQSIFRGLGARLRRSLECIHIVL